MVVSLYKWQNTSEERNFNCEELYILNGIVFKLGDYGLTFTFSKKHVSLSIFSCRVLYSLDITKGNNLSAYFKGSIIFQSVI